MNVVGLGAGGHAKVVIEILRLLDDYELVGLLDANADLRGTDVLGVTVLGDDSLMTELYNQGTRSFFLGLGTIGDSSARRALYETAQRVGFEAARAIHPQALVSSSAKIGDGPAVMAGVVINAGARIDDNVIVNTGAIVEHDCVIQSHAHIASGARLGGGVQVAEGAHVGMGATIRQGVRIGANAIVGAGAVVVEDVPERVTVVGVPAKILKAVRC